MVYHGVDLLFQGALICTHYPTSALSEEDGSGLAERRMLRTIGTDRHRSGHKL